MRRTPLRSVGLAAVAATFATWAVAVSSTPLPQGGKQGRVASSPHAECAQCHEPRDDSDSSWRPPQEAGATICFGCHGSLQDDGAARVDPNEPAGAGHTGGPEENPPLPPLGGDPIERLDCLTCHEPHPNGLPHQLRRERIDAGERYGPRFDPTTDLCLSCHPTAGDFGGPGGPYVRHPIGLTVRRPPAMAGVSPPLLPLADVKGTPSPDDDQIACTTCHFPHASANRYLLRWRTKDSPSACGTCHPDGNRNDAYPRMQVRSIP